jgi:putative transposase
VKVTAAGTKRVSIAGLIAFRPGRAQPARLIHRSILYHGRKHEKKGFDENDYIRLLDAAHQQLRGPIVLVWDNLNTHQVRADARAGRLPALAGRLPATRPRPRAQPGRRAWSAMKAGPANLAKRYIDQLQAFIKTRLRRMQYRPTLMTGLLAKTGLDLRPP